MTTDGRSSGDSQHRVLLFRRRGPSPRASTPGPGPEPDFGQFERGEEDDDYRHRMTMNAAAFVFVIGLIAAGIWLADTMAKMRKDQDCVLSGRRGCTPVETAPDRW